jgi:HNH endonuclease
MTTCIYCRRADVPFNREHVFPEAFGMFSTNNLVLRCVCQGCNTYFGNSIDRTLSRDSFEAVARIDEGLKTPETWQGEGTRSTLRFEYAPDSPFRGVPGHVVLPGGHEDRAELLRGEPWRRRGASTGVRRCAEVCSFRRTPASRGPLREPLVPRPTRALRERDSVPGDHRGAALGVDAHTILREAVRGRERCSDHAGRTLVRPRQERDRTSRTAAAQARPTPRSCHVTTGLDAAIHRRTTHV